MNGALTPRQVTPGWMRRWTRETWSLVRRSPVSIAATLSGIMAADLVYPQSVIGLDVVSLGFFLWTLVLARILDCHCPDGDDHNALGSAWSAFREMLPGALRALVESVALLVGIALLGAMIAWAMQALSLHPFAAATKPRPGQALPLHARMFLDNSLFDIVLLNFPYFLIAFWMGALFGGGLLRHLFIGWYCCLINVRVLFLFIAAAEILTFPGSTALPALAVMGFAIARILIMFLLWLWVYFWIREMFEGRKTNAPRVAVDRKTVLVPAEA